MAEVVCNLTQDDSLRGIVGPESAEEAMVALTLIFDTAVSTKKYCDESFRKMYGEDVDSAF